MSLFFGSIRAWAVARNLIHGSTPQAQTVKLLEEAGELAHALARGNRTAACDALGDTIVVLTILAAQLDLDIEDCIAEAWNQIKDRKGTMVGGIFVKEEDA